MSQAFNLSVAANGVARLVFDLPGEKVNKFSGAVMQELDVLLTAVSKLSDIKVLVLSSPKPGIFIAGADIEELAAIDNQTTAREKAAGGQAVFNNLSQLPFPTIAAIDGACVGGGMECALACTYRLVTNNPKTKLGLPEVSLGIIPGWGGTQRMPRLVGLPEALGLILSGKMIDGSKALKIKLADAIAAPEFFEETLAKFVQTILTPAGAAEVVARRRLPLIPRLLSNWGILHGIVFRKAAQDLHKKTKGHFPAPIAALKTVRRTIGGSLEAGLAVEADAFSELAGTPISQNLVQLFFTNEALKKDAGAGSDLKGTPVQKAAVLGAGVMGGGIAWLLASRDIPTRMKDIQWTAVARGLAEAADYFGQLVKRRKLKPGDANVKLHRIGGSLDYRGFKQVDVVIEAVVENLDIKRKVLAEVETQIRDDAVIATNTSSLSMPDMASALKRPERFVGMHFFNPVNRMPLVEVIAGPKTSPEAIATIVALTRRLGKTPIVVNNCSGFLVNRILIPYLNESAFMLQEGADMQTIDRVVEAFGLPMGPFVLADEVGIDVGVKVAKILESAYGPRMRVAALMTAVYDQKLLGKKGGKGFYVHQGRTKTPNPEIQSICQEVRTQNSISPKTLDEKTIIDRSILIMVNEAARCLEEGIVNRADYLDMAMIMGTGFPPFRGGLLRYADQRGLTDIVQSLQKLSALHGERFNPAPLLLQHEKASTPFYQ